MLQPSSLKFLSLIFFFSFSTLLAQLSPPDLRCLEVQANGDVKLTWIPPSDPNGVFHSYEIFYSSTANGPYTPITNTISSINTNSFIHTGSSATVSGIYYYAVTRSGIGGATTSISSDTLRTLFFTVINNSAGVALQLMYNNIHQPPLVSSASSFTIEKEYPIGTWNLLRITSGLSYFDTISICTASINYKVSLIDNSGCVSISNINGGVFKDTKSPSEPIVDSISVLPDGSTVLGWKIPGDNDIVKYEIQYKTAQGTNSVLTEVNGRSNTSYTYATAAANATNVGIFVGAIDSCNRSSTLNYNLNSMFLKTEYNRCSYTTQLSWNDYLFMQKGILEYQIYYTNDSINFTKIGSTQTTQFTHTKVDAGKKVGYFIRVVNKDKRITASSNRVYFFSSQVQIPDYLYLRTVNAINKTTNQIHILIDTSKPSEGMKILRSDDSLNYSAIGYVTYIGSPNLIFLDENAEPNKKSYYYKAVLTDSCGNERAGSNVVKTILLQVKEAEEDLFTKHLSWTNYLGFAAGVKEYRVFRVINDVAEPNAIKTTNANVTFMSDNVEQLASVGTKIEYFIQAIENTGNPYGVTENSNSNRVEVYIEGRLFIPNAFAPKGVNTKWLPITHFIDRSDYRVQVFNRWGNIVFETRTDNEAWDGGNAPPDIYSYLIHYKNSRGEYKQVTGTVTLMN